MSQNLIPKTNVSVDTYDLSKETTQRSILQVLQNISVSELQIVKIVGFRFTGGFQKPVELLNITKIKTVCFVVKTQVAVTESLEIGVELGPGSGAYEAVAKLEYNTLGNFFFGDFVNAMPFDGFRITPTSLLDVECDIVVQGY